MEHIDTNQHNTKQTMSVWPEAAQILGLGRNAAYAAAARGEIPTIKIGGRVLVLRAALERLLQTDSVARCDSHSSTRGVVAA